MQDLNTYHCPRCFTDVGDLRDESGDWYCPTCKDGVLKEEVAIDNGSGDITYGVGN